MSNKVYLLLAKSSGGGAEEQAILLSGLGLHNPPVEVLYGSKTSLVKQIVKKKARCAISFWLGSDVVSGFLKACGIIDLWYIRESNSVLRPGVKGFVQRFFVLRFANGILANSQPGVEVWKDLGFPVNRILLFPNLIDTSGDFTSKLLPHERFRQIDVVIVSRLVRHKNIDEALQLLNRSARNLGRPIIVWIFGAGPDVVRLAAVSAECSGLRVKFCGWQPKCLVLHELANSCAYMCLSSYEGESNAAMEALVRGCYLLLSDIEANQVFETISEGRAILGKDKIEQELPKIFRERNSAPPNLDKDIKNFAKQRVKQCADTLHRISRVSS